MQWTPEQDAGFSTAQTTWLAVQANYKNVNVKVEETDPVSLLAWNKSLIGLRRDNAILRDGDQKNFDAKNEQIVAYTRSAKAGTLVVLTNFSGTSQQANIAALSGKSVQLLMANFTPEAPTVRDLKSTLALPPYGIFIGTVQK